MIGRAALTGLVLAATGAAFCGSGVGGQASRGVEKAVATTGPFPSAEELRGAGPAGLRRLLDRYDASPDPELLPEIDAVAGQRDAVWSRLYWYTDLGQAEAAARAARKPILYLRLLGELTDEYSCANSRFFRTVLYANPAVSNMLRDRFVLVWESERPVPVVTIDFGDGRVLKRTITGNSVHYVLDPEGHVVDVLPGLFDPVTFASVVGAAGNAAVESTEGTRLEYVEGAEARLALAWTANVAPLLKDGVERRGADAGVAPDAAAAAPIAASKCAVERPMLRAISPQFAASLDESMHTMEESAWRMAGAARTSLAKLDAHSIEMMKSQNPALADPDKLRHTVSGFEDLIGRDSVRNDFELRRRALGWMRESGGTLRVEALNTRVYAELFLTPRSDPWLGLASDTDYSALDCDGRSTTENDVSGCRAAAAP